MAAPRELLFTQGPPETVEKLNRVINALWDEGLLDPGPGLASIRSGGRRKFYATGGGGGASAPNHPWKQFASQWKGEGEDPNAADRALRFRLIRGKIAGRTPANMGAEFLAFGDPTDADIEEDDAVITQVYAEVSVSEPSTGSGIVTFGRPTIKRIEGDDLFDALEVETPNYGTGGALPENVIVPICEVSWWGGSLHFLPGYNSYLELFLGVTGTDCEEATRAFVVVGTTVTA